MCEDSFVPRPVPKTVGRGAHLAHSLCRGREGLKQLRQLESYKVSRRGFFTWIEHRLVSQRMQRFGWVLKGVDFSTGEGQGRIRNTFHKALMGLGNAARCPQTGCSPGRPRG